MQEQWNADKRAWHLLIGMAMLTLLSATPVHATDYPDPALLGEWYLDAMYGQSPAGPTDGMITLNFVDYTVASTIAYSSWVCGHGPCNDYYFGQSAPTARGVWPSPGSPMSTRRGCSAPIMQTEASYFAAFTQIVTYEIIDQASHQRLILYNDAEEAVLEFVSQPELADTLIGNNVFNRNTIYLPLISTNGQ